MYSLGINFLNKLSFTRKFQVILFTLLLPIIYASVIIYLENSNKIELIANRITGLETANHLKPLRILAGKHRGNSAQFLEGNKKVEGAIRSLEQEMAQAITAAQSNLNNPFYSDKSRQILAQIKQNWTNSTLNSIKNKPSLHSFSQHTAWVKEVDSLIHDIATQSGLNRDLSITTQKLMGITVFSTPRLQEQLGQLRAIGSGVATRGEFDSKSFVLANNLFNEIESTILEIEYDFSILEEISTSYIPSELKQARAGIQLFRKITNDQLLKPTSPTVSGSDYFAAGTEAIKHATELLKTINSVYQSELLSNEQQMIKDMMLSLGSFFLLFLISGYLFICLRITVDENARITQNMAIDLEDGRLNQKYHSNSQDELGNTIKALTTSYAKLRDIVSKVRNHSETLSSSSTTLSNVSNEVNTLGEEQKNRVAIISTAATELASTAQEVSSHCELAASKMQESQKQASLGASHSHSSADVIRTLANNVRNAGNEIGELAQQAASISTVIDVIKAIAEQTNLLALNAAIEAARAGEQGRGFAVVADEVRTLATRTQESTNEIENTISSLQQVAEKAVLAMNTSCEQASQSETEATKTGEVLSAIENSINEVSSLIEQVATAGVEQAGAANEIAQNIQAVDDASNDLLIKSQNMSSIASQVGHDSLELDKQMQSFTV